MKSRIQIDFTEQNDPCIVVKYEESDDVRDKLVQKFKEGFEGISNFAKVDFLPDGKGFMLTPLGQSDMLELQTKYLEQATKDIEYI